MTQRYLIIIAYMIVLVVAGLIWPGETPFFQAYLEILTEPSMLVSDFFVVGGIGPALFNAGLVGLMGTAIVYFSKAALSGPTIAALFTLAGFALFGKTPLNIMPIIIGVALGARLVKKPFQAYVTTALFGTALGPVVSVIAYGLSLGYWAGALAGVLIGLVLPATAQHVLQNHQGLSLYNVGFTCGIVGIFAAAILKQFGFIVEPTMIWGTHSQATLATFFSLYCISMIILGWKGRANLKALWKMPGTLPTDFVEAQGLSTTFLNMGLVGLMGMAYIALVRGHFNGATIGGVLTMVGFAALGKHVRNVWPIMLGILLASLISIWNPNSPAVLLAALFGTTLAPVAGSFGPLIGVLAGAVHLAVVMHTGTFHGGMNLYNNGFAGGLVGTLVAGMSMWLSQNQAIQARSDKE